MAIKNYTTKVGAGQSLGEIQDALARSGAQKIMVDYENGAPIALTFAINTSAGMGAFRLPANMAGVAKVLERQKVKCDREQVMRISWRNIRDWVLAQMALIEAGNVAMDEVFLPYLTDGQKTVYELYRAGRLMLPEAAEGIIEGR